MSSPSARSPCRSRSGSVKKPRGWRSARCWRRRVPSPPRRGCSCRCSSARSRRSKWLCAPIRRTASPSSRSSAGSPDTWRCCWTQHDAAGISGVPAQRSDHQLRRRSAQFILHSVDEGVPEACVASHSSTTTTSSGCRRIRPGRMCSNWIAIASGTGRPVRGRRAGDYLGREPRDRGPEHGGLAHRPADSGSGHGGTPIMSAR